MKKTFIISLALAGSLATSCDFLNVDDYFEDTFSEEKIFESQYNIERYFNGAVNELPKEGRMYYWCSEPGATGSDEAVSCGTFYNGILDVSFPGTELTTDKISYTSTGGWDWDFNVWPKCYKVIRKINTMLPHIDDVPDMNAFDKMEFRARCRFLRAYAYYRILQNQGPMILVGDQVYDTNATPDYYQRERSTYDECVDYICSELEAAAENIRLGLLDPDEDISVYLGYEAGNPRYPDVPITLRMLMSHTSGLNENSSYSRLSSKLSDMIALDKKAADNFKDIRPGSQYAYSNFGAGVTGAIIESVTGQDVSSFMREYLFAPLGIDAAYTATQLEEAETYLTATYHKDGSLYRAPSYLLRQAYDAFATPDTHYRVTVGSLLIRPRDLTRLGIALCGDGTVDGVRVLSEKAIAMMRQEQSVETTGITSDTPYSFFTIRKDSLLEGRRVYGHQGTDEGIVCNLYVEPVSQTVFCVMTNGCKTTREDGIMRITRRLCAAAAEVFLPEAN